MSVNIIKKQDFDKGILARDMKEGHAYMDEGGYIYICNVVGLGSDRIMGFGVCGRAIAWESDEEALYIEIDLDIIVK